MGSDGREDEAHAFHTIRFHRTPHNFCSRSGASAHGDPRANSVEGRTHRAIEQRNSSSTTTEAVPTSS